MGIFDRFKKKKEEKPILLNANMGKEPIVLIGDKRRYEIDPNTLTVLLLTASQEGWTGGSNIFKKSGGSTIIQKFTSGMSVTGNEGIDLANTLMQTAEKAGTKLDGNDPMAGFILEFASFCREGAFSIK